MENTCFLFARRTNLRLTYLVLFWRREIIVFICRLLLIGISIINPGWVLRVMMFESSCLFMNENTEIWVEFLKYFRSCEFIGSFSSRFPNESLVFWSIVLFTEWSNFRRMKFFLTLILMWRLTWGSN